MWEGVIYRGHPRDEENKPAEAARMEDAVCANHPTKKAVAICAGTGDYICSLCRVHLNDKDYSVQYLDRGGKPVFDELFAKSLPRPDRMVIVMLLLSAFTLFFLAPIFFLVATVMLHRASKLRLTNQTYRAVASRWGMWLCWFIILIGTIYSVILWSGILNRASRFF